MKVLTLIFFLALLFQTGEIVTEPIKNWKAFPVPSKELARSYNMNSPDWTIFDKDGELFATNDRYFTKKDLPFKIKPKKTDGNKLAGKRSIIEVDDGYLVGFNRGEWGGSLWWFSKDGNERYEISDDIIVSFIVGGKKKYAIQGISHLNVSSGSIIEISKTNGKWGRENYLVLPDAPEGADIYADDFIIITSSSLIRIDENKNIEVLIKDGFWSYLYPTSLIIREKVAFIGMRKGVFTYSLPTGSQDWLMRD